MADNNDTEFHVCFRGSIRFRWVSNESELSLDVRLGGPRRVNLPLRGYLVVLCPKVDALP